MITWIRPTKKPLSNGSGLNYDEIWEFYPEFFDECSKILSGNYPSKSKDFVNSILEFLEDWDIITWKQFYAVFKIHQSYEDYKQHIKDNTYSRKINSCERIVNRGTVSFLCPELLMSSVSSDKEIDFLHQRIFGESPRFYECEEEGMVLGYGKQGERLFYLPTGEEELIDYL